MTEAIPAEMTELHLVVDLLLPSDTGMTETTDEEVEVQSHPEGTPRRRMEMAMLLLEQAVHLLRSRRTTIWIGRTTERGEMIDLLLPHREKWSSLL